MAAAEGKGIDTQGAVSFVVSFNETPKKQIKLPKGLAARRRQQQAKASLTDDSIAEKQKRAEARRQVSMFTPCYNESTSTITVTTCAHPVYMYMYL